MGDQERCTHGTVEGDVPQPLKPRPQTQLPRPLTFFLNAKERAAVLRALRAIDTDRAGALLSALNITPSTGINGRTP